MSPHPETNPFLMQQQQEGNWCWAAVALAIKKYFAAESPLTQCSIAGPVLTHEKQITAATSCCDSPDSCNMPATLQDALSFTHNLREIMANAFLSFEDIKKEFTKSPPRPIGVRIEWPNGGGHFIAIEGYREFSSGAQQVLVADPLYPDGTSSYVDYNDVVECYGAGGTWSDTFLVQP